MGGVAISTGVKISIACVAALLLLLYLVVVDLGVNAGRIHKGVTVGDVSVGGLTETEAAELLDEVGKQMRSSPISFTVGNFRAVVIEPAELGWWPDAEDTARRAQEVGRAGGLLGALADRFKAWVTGVKVKWPGAKPRLMRKELDSLAAELALAGEVLDKPKARLRIRRAIWDWPRRDSYKLPLIDG
jgi:hypothetical protein